MRQLSVLEQLALGSERMTRRLDGYHSSGERVPAAELERARALERMLTNAIALYPLGSDDGQLEELAVARGRLRAAIARAEETR
jgi:hypothetical protein